jgi:hypothetical protein
MARDANLRYNTMQKYKKHFPVILLLITALLIGFFTVKDYGESWDEADIYRYGDYAINAYRYILHPQALPDFNTNLNLYGPGYYLTADLIAHLFRFVIPAWSLVNAWHFVYFLTFLACALLIYLLARRWMSELGAFGAVLLFLSQPLLWGHAVINTKDIPFMAFFTASIYAGLGMVDYYESSSKLDKAFIPAGILLGFTASFRVIGPLAGVLVLGYAIYKLRSKTVFPAVLYLVTAGITVYLTWPYLWSSLIGHYIESLATMSQFPFATDILFVGKLYKANQLPNTYFPTMVGIQLTEPALLLLGLGIAISILLFFNRKMAEPFLLFLAWFLIPALIIIGIRTPLYDNARQLYFLFPPLFILMGLALEKIFVFLTHPLGKAALLLIAALPGILVAARLHPYEYVYYNAFVGGTGGAFRKFEMDYWGVSFKDITEYLNSTAPENASVLAFGPEQTVEQYARPDIKIFIPQQQPAATYDYVAFLTRENLDERRCKGADTIFSIDRRGAILSVLKSIPAGTECR